MPTVKGDVDAALAEWRRKGLVAPESGVADRPPEKPAKYRNRKVEYEGFTFDSKKEFRRWLDLREQQRAGQITHLRRQEEYPLVVNGVEVCRYVADFVYARDGVFVVEDVKSPATRKLRDYRIKVRLMLACLGITVTEV